MKWIRGRNGDVRDEKDEILKEYSDYAREAAEILRSNLTPAVLQAKLSDYHESDIAAALELLTKDERFRVYNVLSPHMLAEILEYADDVEIYFDEMSIVKQAEILSDFEASTAVSYLNELDRVKRESIIGILDDSVRNEIRHVSGFDEDEIGSRMSSNFICIEEGISVRQAMKELVRQAADNDNVSVIYVVDSANGFAGAIDLNDLIVAREDTLLSSITKFSYPYVYENEEIEECVGRIRAYAEESIPVLNDKNQLAGVLTSKDLTELMDDYYGDDYAKLAGLTESEDLDEPVGRSMIKRLPWLVALLGLGLIVSSVVGVFESVVSGLTIIVCFQSLVLDMAGNVGTQSLAVTIRVLMDERLSVRDKWGLVVKEARVGMLNGLILGAGAFLIIGGYIMVAKGRVAADAFAISGCIGIALMIAMFASSIIGTVMPLIFQRMNIDPAVASGPFITTLNDLVAVVAYYGLAGWFLIGVMGMA